MISFPSFLDSSVLLRGYVSGAPMVALDITLPWKLKAQAVEVGSSVLLLLLFCQSARVITFSVQVV